MASTLPACRAVAARVRHLPALRRTPFVTGAPLTSSSLFAQPTRAAAPAAAAGASVGRRCMAASASAGAAAPVASPGDYCKADYTVRLEDGTVVDSSAQGGRPAEFILGSSKVVPGFHAAVGGLAVGEKRTHKARPEDAYGNWNEELIVEIPRNQAPDGLQKDTTVQLSNGMQALVAEVSDDGITLDLNHPLAGKSLEFEVELIKLVPAAQLQKATFGAGCFWSVELAFQRVPGVLSTSVGYAQGRTENPTYQDVCRGDTGHNEVVQVVYDTEEVNFDTLLDAFWAKHDPTTPNRQGGDVGEQYRSGIYYYTEEQRAAAEASKARQNERLGGRVVTEIEQAGPFYEAEEYHQRYLEKGGRFGQAQSAAKGCTDPIRCYG